MLAIKYSVFAVIATMLNLIFQFLSFQIYNGVYSLYLAMTFGTLAGLLSKYVLDKKYIFYHSPTNKTDDVVKFILYSFMGIFTTAIFWGTEIAFDVLIDTEYSKYIGAIIGLSIGYVIKYFLDKRFVFIHKEVA